MRYSQIILEFDLSKTTARFGRKLLDRVLNDPSYYPDSHAGNGGLAAISSAKHRLMRKWKKADRPANYDDLVLDLAAEEVTNLICYVSAWMTYGGRTVNDPRGPAPLKAMPDGYIFWWLQRYIDGGIGAWEDFRRVQRALRKYIHLQESGYFRRTPEAAQYRDIGRFKGLVDLEAFTDSVATEEAVSNAEKDRPDSKEYKMLADGERWRVVVPLTQKAASYFGRNTKWCTTSENGGQFTRYAAQSDLYIIIDKPNNRRWQFHFKTKQYMDELDRRVGLNSFPEDFWEAMPEEMFIEGMKHDSSSIIFNLTNTIFLRMSPDVIGTLPLEVQTQFVKYAPFDGDNEEHYRNGLRRVSLDALAIAYSVAWHWDQGPLIASQMFRRNSRSTVIAEGRDWEVRQFPTISEALRFDIDQHGNTKEMWKILDASFRGHISDYARRLEEFKNSTMIVTPRKNYLFSVDGRTNLRVGWDGHLNYSINWYEVAKKMQYETIDFGDYDGPNDPEMWKAVYKSLTERKR